VNLRCSTFHTNISPRAAFNLNNSGPLQFVGKAFSQCSSEITAEFALPRLLRPNNWEKHPQHTHTNHGLDNLFRLMLPLCFSMQSQPAPHKHTLQLHWPLHTQSRKRSTTKSSYCVPMLQDPPQEIFVPPLWQPPTVIDHHKTTHDQVFWRLFTFFAQIRIATFWTITVCCYLQMCVHVHAARFRDVWLPGFRLGVAWVRQNRNPMNIDAQQNTTAKHVPFEVPWLKANASHYKM